MSDSNKRVFVLRDRSIYANILELLGKCLSAAERKIYYRVTVERYHRKRTLDQNALLHVIISHIAKELGNTLDDQKEFLVRKLDGEFPFSYHEPVRMCDEDGVLMLSRLGQPMIHRAKRTGYRRRSTAKMTTVECSELIDKILAWAATEADFVVPTRREVEEHYGVQQ